MIARWGNLNTEGAPDQGYVRLRLREIEGCAAYVARRLSDDAEALLFEVDTENLPSQVKYPESAGLSLVPEVLQPGRHGRTRLNLSLADERFRDVFHALGEDIILEVSEASDEKRAVKCLLSRLARWQAFLKKHGATGLSRDERRGLFGELSFMYTQLLECIDPSTAVHAWVGCRGANHDFQYESCSIEVKTTHASTPHSFHVSNIRQLSDDAVSALYLHLVAVEESDAAAQSLPEIVDQIRASLGDMERETFNESLVEAGYLDEQADLYRSPKYGIRWTRSFAVGPGFPRLVEGVLPDGVEGVRYQVAVAACTPFECTLDEVFDCMIGQGS